ncbi:NS2 [Peruvian horse sickness virus]|uniref:Non-structural protein NS2 n=1 Tax=Peruvian horse sickness virus TaxID=356862 RepID=Q2Q1D6_9REOV|nr:NS2 [Peruvian horse sickness virus]ABB72778.1 NS2 [Peruvian horse sickness virus]
MDQKRENFTGQNQMQMQNADRANRVLTRTFSLYSLNNNNFIGKVTKCMNAQYLAVKVGITTHFEAVNVPPPRSTVITVSNPCAFKVQDRETTTHFMISESGLEACLGRWSKYKFESVDTTSRFCKMSIGGQTVEETIRVGKCLGIVQPYTEEEMMDIGEGIELPGISFVNLQSEEVAEFRSKLRVERDMKRDLIGVALKESGAARSEGRLFGLKLEATAKLQPMKKLTARIQSKTEEKPKVQRTVKSPFSPISTKNEMEFVENTSLKMMRSKTNSEVSLEKIDDHSTNEAVLQAEKMKLAMGESRMVSSPVTGIAGLEATMTLMNIHKPNDVPIATSPLMVVPSFKITEEYRELTATIQMDPSLPAELSVLEIAAPGKMGSVEKIATSFSFHANTMLPVFNVNSSTCEYKFAGYDKASRAILAVSAGCLVILPVL